MAADEGDDLVARMEAQRRALREGKTLGEDGSIEGELPVYKGESPSFFSTRF